jgi:hypothetical protein
MDILPMGIVAFKRKRQNTVLVGAALLLPFGAMAVWSALGHSIELKPFFFCNRTVSFLDPQQRDVFWFLLKYFCQCVFSDAPVQTVLILAACLLSWKEKTQRPIVIAVLLQSLFFLIGAFVVYVKGFGPHHRESAPSFPRYLTIVYQSGAVVAVAVLCKKLGMRYKMPGFDRKRALVALATVCLLGAVRSRAGINEFAVKQRHPFLAEIDPFLAYIDSREKQRVSLLFVDQENTYLSRGPLRYGLVRTAGTMVDLYPSDYFDSRVTREDFRKILEKVDYVWIYRADPFVGENLRPYLTGVSELEPGGWYERSSLEPLVFTKILNGMGK